MTSGYYDRTNHCGYIPANFHMDANGSYKQIKRDIMTIINSSNIRLNMGAIYGRKRD
jgi:hypothetical protein